MNEELEAGAAPPGGTPGVPGWYADPFSNTLLRWWTGQSWTFSTTDGRAGPVPPPPPSPPTVMPTPPPLPAPRPPATAPRPATPTSQPTPPRTPGAVRTFVTSRKVLVAVVVGLIVGVIGVRILDRPTKRSTSGSDASGAAGGRVPTTTTPGSRTAPADPSASALSSLVVKPADVSANLTVVLLPGGGGLSQATLDLCNGTYPSEARRTARLQDVVLDDQGKQLLSTEAVLYADSAGTTQAFSELRTVSSSCPSTPVPSPVGEPTVITKFNPAPDGSWPQTATVSRVAFDLTTTDSTGQTDHTVAVYLRRGRALMGVYFGQPDGPQPAVAGETTIPGIVGVFAARMAALPASVVGS